MTDDGDGTHRGCADCGAYLLGALRPDTVLAFEGHLLECARCQVECEELGPAVSALTGLGPDETVEPPGPAPRAVRRGADSGPTGLD
ncbi:hypothetical protein E1211_12520 [Micromonospora sp. 15K316]|uniref:zf-HC2 domain-containing protein n=1 Tax=Micromonospora sp. 15K316 TaxID=2530376 RepID=UPI00104E18FA|nr:zf-HC2 domain-containing protein [Micromonospora sp. 15K316]TDC36780.1 hypothetical protein E1211_12520 [Micromonospora sp. 15K316]